MSSAVTPQSVYLEATQPRRRIVRSAATSVEEVTQPTSRQAAGQVAEPHAIEGVSSFLLLMVCGAVSLTITGFFAAQLVSQLSRFSIHDLIRAFSGLG